MSIVLVIIGLLVGGIVVGQNLIVTAGIRAQITQIEKYNSATNTFRDKYNALPGDIPDPAASSFGLQARGANPGQGDGNGIIEGGTCWNCGAGPHAENGGETVVFWVDLSTAHLIDGGFNTAKSTLYFNPITASTTPNLDALFPAAKIGRGNYIYVYAGSYWISPVNYLNGSNYFGISAITEITGNFVSNPALTVAEAYAIDSKIDDGLPQYGRVTAQYITFGLSPGWQSNGAPNGSGVGSTGSAPITNGIPGSSASCYDNGNANGVTQHYSIEISNGSNVTCALSFQFQ